jgi:antitoxin component of MazEF toxin-antitoxin module
MQTVKIFRAGNSDAVVIPRPLLREIGVRVGEEVVVEKVPDGKAVIVTPVKDKTRKTPVKGEFDRWFKMFLKENSGILDDLA